MSEIKLRSDPEKLKNIHVLFIHGLGGDADKTWLRRAQNKEAWPLWLLEDIDDINIWSIEYSAPKFKLNDDGMGTVFVNVVVVQTVLLCRLILRCFLFVRVEHHRPNRLPVARVA
jgi:hypothetical protein